VDTTVDTTEWVFDRIVDLYPGESYLVGIAVPQLVEAIQALRGGPRTVFGLSSKTGIDPERVDDVIDLALDALGAWRQWCHANGYEAWESEISRFELSG
jgi:hypothetical protein